MQSYTRHQLKEDKFAKGAQEAVHWATEHRSKVIWSIAIVVVAAVAITGLVLWNNNQSVRANEALASAIQTLNAPIRPAGAPADPNTRTFANSVDRAKKAAKQFQDVAANYPHTKPGKMAAYLAGAATIQAADIPGAEQQLKSVADSGDRNVSALAKLALANIYGATNRAGDAAKTYRELIDHPTDTVPKDEAQIRLAELYEASDPKEAANLYQQIKKENPDGVAAQIADAKLRADEKGGK